MVQFLLMRRAFDIHKLVTSTGASKFPLVYAYRDFGDYYSLNISVISLDEIVDIVQKYAHEKIMIFAVDHYLDSISEIADDYGVRHFKYDNDNIIISKRDLKELIDFAHYNFKLLDANFEINEMEYLELLEKIQNNKYEKVEKDIANSNIWIDIHDNCFLYTESKSKKYLNEIKERSIESLIKSNINSDDSNIELDETVTKILVENNMLTIMNKCTRDENYLSFPIIYDARNWFSFNEHIIENNDQLVYDMNSGIVFVKKYGKSGYCT